MKRQRVLALDLPAMLAGTRFRGDFDERLRGVVAAVAAAPDIILFVDELHTLVGAGDREGGLDAGNMLKPVLARGQLRCIGATTTGEYEQHLGKDKALMRRFQPVLVREPSREDALVMLRGLKERYEAHHGIRIADAALVAAVDLSTELIKDRFLPDKAIDLVDEAASQLRLEAESVPAAVAQAEEALLRLEIEHRALGGEERSALVQQRRTTSELRQRWADQRRTVALIRELIHAEEGLRLEEEHARRTGQVARAAEITYRALPSLSQRIEALEAELHAAAGGGLLLRDTVVAADVATIAAAWSGRDLLPD
jgi:ATP-dependent Clp protease ATP-binding subunit ClpB